MLLVRQQHSSVLLAGLERRNLSSVAVPRPCWNFPVAPYPVLLCPHVSPAGKQIPGGYRMLCPVLAVAQSIVFLQPGSKQVSAEGGRNERGCSALPMLFFLPPLGCIPTIPGRGFPAQRGIWKGCSPQHLPPNKFLAQLKPQMFSFPPHPTLEISFHEI